MIPHPQYYHELNESYLKKIRSQPILSLEEEYQLAKDWKEKGDKEAVNKLIESHLRLVAKIASGYRGYGLPLNDLIAEGNIGIMHALKHFDYEKGFRFSTYAMWWIKASIQEYILNTWSMVRFGTTAAHKKLFFKLKKIKEKLGITHLTKEDLKTIAKELDVREEDVARMDERMSGQDHSLNTPLKSSEDSDSEWIEWLIDAREDQETHTIHQDELLKRRSLLNKALQMLTPREKDVLFDRRLAEPPLTLDALSIKYGISRERVRQIEIKAFEKLQKAVKFHAKDINYRHY